MRLVSYIYKDVSIRNNNNMWQKAAALIMTEEDQRTKEAWLRAQKTPQRILLRYRICLLATESMFHNAIAKRLNT